MNTAADHAITVVGGVYQERCMRPQWQEVYGSAGRAAMAIASMGGNVDLVSYFDSTTQAVFEAQSALTGISLHPTSIGQAVSFDYYHGLDTPRISIPKTGLQPLQVEADCVVRFGMLEGDAQVRCKRAVYDPQNPHGPTHFQDNGSSAEELALVLNRHEARVLSALQNSSAEDMAKSLIAAGTAQVVVIKEGPSGALVHDGSNTARVPAYETDHVWKIGSGDNFVAHFAYRWLIEGRGAIESAELASQATAYYCQTRGFATKASLTSFKPRQFQPSNNFASGYVPTIYLAGPFFTLAQLWMVEQARDDLRAMGLKVFSPYHDVGHGSAEDVVEKDLDGIDSADLVFAIGDGLDSGTIYEIGYARAKGKPVVMYCESESEEDRKMMEGSGCVISSDYVTAIYKALWAAAAL